MSTSCVLIAIFVTVLGLIIMGSGNWQGGVMVILGVALAMHRPF